MKTKSFALSTLAALIQTLITTTQAEAVEYNLEKTRGISLEDNTEKITWKSSRLTVAGMSGGILPVWEKDRVNRELEVITTGKGENNNLIVNGYFGIRSVASNPLGYSPKLLIKSNNDIIFNNDEKSVTVTPYAGGISLEAEEKIKFNLSVDKTRNLLTGEYDPVNNGSLLEYDSDSKNKGTISLNSKTGNLLNMSAKIHNDAHHFGINNKNNVDVNLTASKGNNVISLVAELVDPITNQDAIQSKNYLRGIQTAWGSNTTLSGVNNKVNISTVGDGLGLGLIDTPNVNSYHEYSVGIFATGRNTPQSNDGSTVSLKATEGNNEIDINAKNHASTDGLLAMIHSQIVLDAKGDNIIKVKNPDRSTALMKGKVNSNRAGIQSSTGSDIVLNGKNNIVKIGGNPIYQDGLVVFDNSTIALKAEGKNEIEVDNALVASNGLITSNIPIGNKLSQRTTGNKIILDAGGDNTITLKVNDQDIANASTVLKQTDLYESKYGSIGIYSQGENSLIKLTGENNIVKTELTGDKVKEFKHRGILSEKRAKVQLKARNTNEIKGAQFGLYANENSSVSLTASNNIINSTNVGISSLNNATVDVNGQIKLSSKIANYASTDGSIKLNYANKSEITGATLSNGGNIAIKPLDFSPHTMALTGDVLSVNKGKVELNLTPNSHLVGRLDNFAQFDHPEHKNINNLDAQSAGEINLNLAKDAVWTMTGQSWLDKLEGQGTIDFNNDAKASGRSLHIGELAGANKFLMHLNKDGAHSDMIYVKKGTTTPQDVTITNLSEVLDMMNYGDRLRFATIQENSGNEFIDGKRYIDDSHLMEQALTVEYSDHQSDPSNKPDYNLAFNGDKMTAEKAGNADVDAMYNGEHRKNVYLVKKKLNPDCNCNNPSKGVKDVTGMFDSTAHYAFTLDTYTKREGERAYSSLDKKDGAWVRAVHTKLTQSGVFRFHNNDYEIGYDKFSRNDTEKKRKWGLSFTYGRAKVSLSNQFSKGRIKKYELSFYNTNQRQNKEGDDSAYHDNVLRIGLLRSHSYASMNNGKLWGKGSYRNKYFTVSTEYGYRKFINDDKRWYVVPQAQLQFTYLNGVDYKLSNGVNVSLNHTKSLIGRVGIDIVRLLDDEREQKDLRERRFYIKGNILHEFLAKRSFIGSYSADNYSKTWNNRGTWYAIGLGYNAHVSEKTYIFIDAERELGAGRANSYNARLAISWQFK